MVTGRQPVPETRFRFADIDRGNAQLLKAEFVAPGANFFGEVGVVDVGDADGGIPDRN